MEFLFIDNDKPKFFRAGTTYTISSHPYDPCTYLIVADTIVCTLRVAFDYVEIARLIREGTPLTSIDGRSIDKDFLCDVFSAALDDGRCVMDFPFAARLADKRRERVRLAHRIEATRDSVCMGDDCHAPHATDLLYWDETTLSEFMKNVSEYVPAMKNATWCVMSQDRTLGHLTSGDDGCYRIGLAIPDGVFKDLGAEEIFCRYMRD